MSAIHVCPLSRLTETVSRSGARHIVTLINRGTEVPSHADVDPANHLFVHVNDICGPADGMVCPAEEHVAELLEAFRQWDRQAPIVVHCFAGVSRSTAAAFAAFCMLRPDLDEADIAARIRSRSPQATPNTRIVAIADDLLGRGGRMRSAVAAIGRGADAFEGSVFALHLDEKAPS